MSNPNTVATLQQLYLADKLSPSHSVHSASTVSLALSHYLVFLVLMALKDKVEECSSEQ